MKLKDVFSFLREHEEILDEKIFAGYITVFHRTKSLDIIDKISHQGFKKGIMFYPAQAVFCTFEEKDQNNCGMRRYGNYIIKGLFKKGKVISFDDDASKDLFGKVLDIEDQFALYNLPYSEDLLKLIPINKNGSQQCLVRKDFEWRQKNNKEMPDAYCYESPSKDGHVIAVLNPSLLIPVAWKEDYKTNWNQFDTVKKNIGKQVRGTFQK